MTTQPYTETCSGAATGTDVREYEAMRILLLLALSLSCATRQTPVPTSTPGQNTNPALDDRVSALEERIKGMASAMEFMLGKLKAQGDAGATSVGMFENIGKQTEMLRKGLVSHEERLKGLDDQMGLVLRMMAQVCRFMVAELPPVRGVSPPKCPDM